MIEPKIVFYFSLDSESEEAKGIDFDDCSKVLPPIDIFYRKDEVRMLLNGKEQKWPNKSTYIRFYDEYHTFDLDEACDSWLEKFMPYKLILMDITSRYGMTVTVDFEVTIYDMHDPAIVMENNFISFINDLGGRITFYYYYDTTENSNQSTNNRLND